MSKFLAIDASSEQCSVALSIDGQVDQLIDKTPRSHAQNLLPMVNNALDNARVLLCDLDAIVFGEGPGSFTGLRIAIGIAQGLAYGGNLPLINVCGLNALAWSEKNQLNQNDKLILSALDARMNEVYWGLFGHNFEANLGVSNLENLEANANLSSYQEIETKLKSVVKHCQLDSLYVIGQMPEALEERLAQTVPFTYKNTAPEAINLLEIAEQKYKKGQILQPERAEPLYLRNQVAWKKRKKIRDSSIQSNCDTD